MTTQQNMPSTGFVSAWMPLEGLIEQWGCFGSEATTVPALFYATSQAFAALAQEMKALEQRREAYRSPQGMEATDLESCLVALMQAWQCWTEAIYSLERLVPGERKMDADSHAITSFLTEALEQRLRVSMLIQEIEHEQLTLSREKQHE